MKIELVVSLCATVALLVACGKKQAPAEDTASAPTTTAAPVPAEAPPPAEMPPAAAATAQLAATQGNTASGELKLTAEGETVHLTGMVHGLKPNGEFGFHIHEKGDCSAPDASSAGGHFNPTNSEHGDPQGATHHGGDMLNVKSDADGMAQVDAVASGVSLTSGQPGDVHGKAIVMHEKRDDYKTQPSGDSGKRIACGVIN